MDRPGASNSTVPRWTCTECTFENHPALNECEFCEKPKISNQQPTEHQQRQHAYQSQGQQHSSLQLDTSQNQESLSGCRTEYNIQLELEKLLKTQEEINRKIHIMQIQKQQQNQPQKQNEELSQNTKAKGASSHFTDQSTKVQSDSDIFVEQSQSKKSSNERSTFSSDRAVKTAIICKGVPNKINTVYELRKRFSQFGLVTKVIAKPENRSAIVHFENHIVAAKAKEKGAVIEPCIPAMKISWTKCLPKCATQSKEKDVPTQSNIERKYDERESIQSDLNEKQKTLSWEDELKLLHNQIKEDELKLLHNQIKEVTGIHDENLIHSAIVACQDHQGHCDVKKVIAMLVENQSQWTLKDDRIDSVIEMVARGEESHTFQSTSFQKMHTINENDCVNVVSGRSNNFSVICDENENEAAVRHQQEEIDIGSSDSMGEEASTERDKNEVSKQKIKYGPVKKFKSTDKESQPSKPMLKRKQRCGRCKACNSTDCGECRFCKDKTKNGGPNQLRKPCVNRRCMGEMCLYKPQIEHNYKVCSRTRVKKLNEINQEQRHRSTHKQNRNDAFVPNILLGTNSHKYDNLNVFMQDQVENTQIPTKEQRVEKHIGDKSKKAKIPTRCDVDWQEKRQKEVNQQKSDDLTRLEDDLLNVMNDICDIIGNISTNDLMKIDEEESHKIQKHLSKRRKVMEKLPKENVKFQQDFYSEQHVIYSTKGTKTTKKCKTQLKSDDIAQKKKLSLITEDICDSICKIGVDDLALMTGEDHNNLFCLLNKRRKLKGKIKQTVTDESMKHGTIKQDEKSKSTPNLSSSSGFNTPFLIDSSDRSYVPKREFLFNFSPEKRKSSINADTTKDYPNFDGTGQFEIHPVTSADQNEAEIKKVLLEKFGFKEFRENQLEIIKASLAKHDCFILMPTGGGKSLCYQLPSLLTRGVSLIVSPLKSLMQDQVSKLKAKSIPAEFLSSGLSKQQTNLIYEKLRDPDQLMLYVTPENIYLNERLHSLLDNLYEKDKLKGFIIDEAHCISQWGHDFRPDYKKLNELRVKYQGVPVMALTATATVRVRYDIIKQLNMKNTKWFVSSFDRPNLKFQVVPKRPTLIEDMTKVIKERFPDKCGIVYCLTSDLLNEDYDVIVEIMKEMPCDVIEYALEMVESYKKLMVLNARKECNSTAAMLDQSEIKALPYHAGLSDLDREQIQKEWISGRRCKVICATTAFGMGIDKATVKFVIHSTLPKSLEGYYQEAGRAGRNDKPAECILYYTYKDVSRWRGMFEKSSKGASTSTQVGNLYSMVQYCENRKDCRRLQILKYFEEDNPDSKACKRISKCDNCASKRSFELKDVTEDAKLIIKSVQSLNSNAEEKRNNFTLPHLVDVFKGSNNRKITELGHDKLPLHGKGKLYSKNDAERLFIKLVIDGVLKEDLQQFVCYLKLGDKAPYVLYNAIKIELHISTNESSKVIKTAKTSSEMTKTAKKITGLVKATKERSRVFVFKNGKKNIGVIKSGKNRRGNNISNKLSSVNRKKKETGPGILKGKKKEKGFAAFRGEKMGKKYAKGTSANVSHTTSSEIKNASSQLISTPGQLPPAPQLFMSPQPQFMQTPVHQHLVSTPQQYMQTPQQVMLAPQLMPVSHQQYVSYQPVMSVPQPFMAAPQQIMPTQQLTGVQQQPMATPQPQNTINFNVSTNKK